MLGTIKTDQPLKVMSENWGPLLFAKKELHTKVEFLAVWTACFCCLNLGYAITPSILFCEPHLTTPYRSLLEIYSLGCR
ncbi:hypothetical protein DLR60_08340 [Vibrio tarriae]|nr:hypothetical protein F0315_12465 [Vibrio cholerae]RBM26963.1 hypothetical protein DLR59_10300 [Vibrio tarriae]RBM28309.1 hypothetical protein DLR61_11650 [Vibrio tarriae]RBM32090.1 hypothetical protein DLR58_15140 [Vibrio tarriae]RBM33590.1 hypothetical protein DLR63_18435 [Vibrio tarriae]